MSRIRNKTAKLLAEELGDILVEDPTFPEQDIISLRLIIRKLIGDEDLSRQESQLAAYILAVNSGEEDDNNWV